MSRTRLILLATALFLTLSATAGLAAANLPSSTSGGINGVQRDFLDATQHELQTIVSEVLPNLLPDPVPDGAVPDEAGVDPDRAEPSDPEIVAIPDADPSKLLGKDGRFTVLILGTDKRKGIVGERTDTMIVATLNPQSGDVAMVSMPRDTVNVPIGKGRVYADRINSLYWSMLQSSGKKKPVALKKTREAFEFAFDTEIDYSAMVDFDGLVRLINAIGGVEVKVQESIVDPGMHITKKGLRLKKGERTLDGKTALAFSRSRHTTSDYDRARRQQDILAAAVDKVRDSGLEALPSLLALVRKNVVTDIPLSAAPALLQLAKGAGLMGAKNMVLEPGKWARTGSVLYTIVPNMGAVRAMMNKAFGPVRGR